MRKLICVAALLAVMSVGCEPQIIFFAVQPSSVACGTTVTLSWKISVGDGELSSDQPVTPSLNPPQKVYPQGSKTVKVTKTTTFKLSLPYGGEKTVKVTVNQPCSATCGNQTLTFTGTCTNANQGPTYSMQTAGAAVGSGTLKDLQNDANFPVHVLHAGADIALGAGGGPIGSLPALPAAGDYTIYVPGQVGQNICAGVTPVGGGPSDAPPVHLTVIPNCPP